MYSVTYKYRDNKSNEQCLINILPVDKGCPTVAGVGGMELQQRCCHAVCGQRQWGPGQWNRSWKVCHPAQEIMVAANGAHGF